MNYLALQHKNDAIAALKLAQIKSDSIVELNSIALQSRNNAIVALLRTQLKSDSIRIYAEKLEGVRDSLRQKNDSIISINERLKKQKARAVFHLRAEAFLKEQERILKT